MRNLYIYKEGQAAGSGFRGKEDKEVGGLVKRLCLVNDPQEEFCRFKKKKIIHFFILLFYFFL